MFNPENIYSSNIIHTKHIVLMYLGMCIGCVYWHMYIKQLMKKCHEYEGIMQKYMGGLGAEREGEIDLIML